MHVLKEVVLTGALKLNAKSPRVIPLWPVADAKKLRDSLWESSSFWRDIRIADHGKYLGFMIGPGAGSKSWTKPCEKFGLAAAH